MINSELEAYKELHSQLITQIVNMHNAHLKFLEVPYERPGFHVRKALREMVKIEKLMIKLSNKVSAERRRLLKLERQQKAEYKRLNPGKPGRPKKEIK